MKNIKTLNDEKDKIDINCLQILDDGRLAAADSRSKLTIYNRETFKPEIIIKNFSGELLNFTQLKNKNIACSLKSKSTLKIIKINNKNEYKDIQIIN